MQGVSVNVVATSSESLTSTSIDIKRVVLLLFLSGCPLFQAFSSITIDEPGLTSLAQMEEAIFDHPCARGALWIGFASTISGPRLLHQAMCLQHPHPETHALSAKNSSTSSPAAGGNQGAWTEKRGQRRAHIQKTW